MIYVQKNKARLFQRRNSIREQQVLNGKGDGKYKRDRMENAQVFVDSRTLHAIRHYLGEKSF